MRNRFIAFLAVFFLAGCDTANRSQELEQQRLLLELTKANTERLAELTEKERELKSLANQYQDAAEQLKRQEALLGLREREIAQREKRLAEETAAAAARQEEINAKAADLENRLLALRQQEEAEQQKREAEQRELEERQRPEILSRLNRRKPELEALHTMTMNSIMKHNPNAVQSSVRKELTEHFDVLSLKLAKIEEEDAFAHEAMSIVIEIYNSTCDKLKLKYELLPMPRALYSMPDVLGDFGKKLVIWEADYVKRHQTKDQ